MAKLKEEYQNRIIGELEQKLGTTNRMLVPRLQKIVVNMGFGIVSTSASSPRTSRRASWTTSRRSRASVPSSARRRSPFRTSSCARAWSSARRSPSAATACGTSPSASSTRRFRASATSAACRTAASTAAATTRSVDGRGNYTLGLKEHAIFPELVEATGPNCGMDVTFVTSSKDNKAAKELLIALGMPFAGRN